MHIVICGSMKHAQRMTELAVELTKRGHVVQKPNVVEGHVYEDNLDANAALKRGFIDEHFAKIDNAEAVLVVNEDKNGVAHYIGGNTLIEIAYAYSRGLNIFLLNPVPELGYADEIRGMHPTVLDGDIDKIEEYIASLPLVYMSTESELKQLAVSRAFRRAGTPVRVNGKKVASGVPEQPASIDETYEGAMHRHEQLSGLNKIADYYVTIESGYHKAHAQHTDFGCSVVIVEQAKGEQRVGIDLDVAFPAEMLAKVPAQYADLGVLVQQEYGAVSKDPYPFFTNGRLTRRQLLENASYNVIVQLPIKRKQVA